MLLPASLYSPGEMIDSMKRLQRKAGRHVARADLNLACAMQGAMLNDDTAMRAVRVAVKFTDPARMTIAMLCDPVQSGALRRADLYRAGFPARVRGALRALVPGKRPFFNFIEDLGRNPDSLAVEIEILRYQTHLANFAGTVTGNIRDATNRHLLALQYLEAVRDGEPDARTGRPLKPGACIADFLRTSSHLDNKDDALRLLSVNYRECSGDTHRAAADAFGRSAPPAHNPVPDRQRLKKINEMAEPLFSSGAIAERAVERGAPAGVALALFIMGAGLFGKRVRSGDDFAVHPIFVADQASTAVGVIEGLLHESVEDSDLKLDHLRYVGYPGRIVDCTDSVSRRKAEGELYFDFVERCSLNADGLLRKFEGDTRHNLDTTRPGQMLGEGPQTEKASMYRIAMSYYAAVLEGKIERGSSIVDFMRDHTSHLDPGTWDLLLKHSRRARALKEAGLEPVFAPATEPAAEAASSRSGYSRKTEASCRSRTPRTASR